MVFVWGVYKIKTIETERKLIMHNETTMKKISLDEAVTICEKNGYTAVQPQDFRFSVI